MKLKSIIAIALMAVGLSANAQTLSRSMESAIAACQGVSQAIGNSSTAPLKAANKVLKAADIVNFGDLSLKKGKDLDVNGHLIFDEEFLDSLIVNRKVLAFSSRYAKKRSHRGSTGVEGRIRMTTKALKAGQSATWKTVNKGTAEFAVVAEPGGLLTMTIRNEKGKVLYAETVRNKQGAPMRKAQLKLPENESTTLLIEVVNHATTDTSFAILKN